MNTLEVFLLKALKFQLHVYSPLDLIDFLVGVVREQVQDLNTNLLKAKILEQIIKVYQIEQFVFLYTPSQIALACLDLALCKLSEEGQLNQAASVDLTTYFPDLEISVWDKVGDIKSPLKTFAGAPKPEQVTKIRQELARFHMKHPEFLKNI